MNEWILLILFMLIVIVAETVIFAAGQYAQTHQAQIYRRCDC